MRFGIERNIITKQTVMNEAVDGETERGAAGGVRLLRRRGGREGEPGGLHDAIFCFRGRQYSQVRSNARSVT